MTTAYPRGTHESFEAFLRRFKRLCEKAGILPDLRRHEYYEKPTAKRKRKKSISKKRALKKEQREKIMLQRDKQPIGTDS